MDATRSGRAEQPGNVGRILSDRNPGVRKGRYLRLRRALVPLDDRARMSHPLSGRRRATGHVRHDSFRHVLPDELRGVLFRGPADLADENDSPRPSVAFEETKGLDHARADDGIPADADAGGLAVARLRHRVHNLVGQRAAPRYDARVPRLEDVIRHDAHLRLARRGNARAVRADDCAFATARVGHQLEAVVEGDPFRDDDDELEPRFDRLDGGVFRVRRRDEDNRGVRLATLDGLPHAVVDGDTFDRRAPLAGRDARHDLRAELEHRMGMELALVARDALDHDAALRGEEDGRLTSPLTSL